MNCIDNVIKKSLSVSTTGFSLFALLLLAVVCLCFSITNLTNESMAAGDAKRIYPYIEFVEHVPEYFPTWNPYKMGGLPTLAEAERFLGLAGLISANQRTSFVQFNAVLVSLYFMLSIAVYLFAKQFQISQLGALIAAIIFISSQFVFNAMKSGRIEAILSMSLVFFTFTVYSRFIISNKVISLIGGMIMTAFVFNSQGYYAAVFLLPIMILIGIENRNKCFFKSLSIAIMEVGFISGGGVLLGAIFLVPLLDYSFSLFTNFSPKTTLVDTQPIISSLINMIYPISIQKQKNYYEYLYCGFAVLPLILVYLSTRKRAPWRNESLFIKIFLFGFLFTLGDAFPFSMLIDFVASAPVIGNIRWAASFQFLMLISLALFSGAAIDRFKFIQNFPGVKNKSAFLILSMFALGVILHLVFKSSFFVDGIKRNPEIIIYLLATILIPFIINSKANLTVFLAVFIILAPVLNRPYSEMHRLYDQALPDSYGSVIREDPSYFSVFLKRGRTGMAGIRNINGFSMYFSEEHRRTLDLLYGIRSDAMRPHWVKAPALGQWNPGMVDLLNIKYVEIRKKDYSDLLAPGWAVVAEESDTVLLKRRGWSSSLRFYEDVEIRSLSEISTLLSEPEADVQRVLFTDAHSTGKALVTSLDDPVLRSSKSAESEILITRYSGSRVTLDVTSDREGFVLFPENWDRYWTANRNGIDVPIIRAFGIFRAVAIHAGENQIEMSYRAASFRWGIVISSTFLVLLIFILLIKLISSKRKKLNNFNQSLA